MYKKTIGMRLIAFLIDFLIAYVGVGLILHATVGLGTVTRTDDGVTKSVFFSLNFYEIMIVVVIYYLIFAIIFNGKTIGKFITRVEIRRMDLEKVEKRDIILREFMKSLLILISLVSFILVLARGDRKSLHDLMADTIVVRKTRKSDFIEPKTIPND